LSLKRDPATTPTPSPYPLPAKREPLLLYEGQLGLSHHEAMIDAEGRLELELVPSLRFRFAMPDAPVTADVTGNASLFISGLNATAPVFVTNASLFGGTVKGSLDLSSSGSVSGISEVRFLVANLPDFLGEPLADDDARTGISLWAGRLTLRHREWLITLDERRDYRDVYARLKAEGGFEITHTAVLRRSDGRTFSDEEAADILNALAGFLGLASGAWAPPVAATGLDSAGNAIWREWNSRWTSPWISRLSAFDRHQHDLSGAFAGYVDRWSQPVWNEPLRIATQMYIEANGPITADTSLVVGQALLELVAWVRFVEELQTRTPADFDNPRAKASERLRELLTWIGISPRVPSSLAALDHEAAQRGWTDGPQAITEMRNSLVHPRRRQRLTATPVRARIELQELVLWYAELALLRLIDYRGGYANRLGVKATGIVEDVPWK
jgi:hypothetical protein